MKDTTTVGVPYIEAGAGEWSSVAQDGVYKPGNELLVWRDIDPAGHFVGVGRGEDAFLPDLMTRVRCQVGHLASPLR